MISRIRSRLVGLGSLAALATLFVGSACVQDQEFLIVERAVWYGSEDPSDGCVLDPSSIAVGRMTADVSYPVPIGLGLVVTNRTSPNGGSNTGIDDSEIYVESAEISLSFSGGGLSTSTYDYLLPSNSIGGGDSMAVQVEVPPDIVESMAATMAGLPFGTREVLEMSVVVKGRKANQTKIGSGALGAVETRLYTFPFEICYGCMSNCCTDANNVMACATPSNFFVGCGGTQTGVLPLECAE